MSDHRLSRAEVIALATELGNTDGRIALTDLAMSVWVENLQGRAMVDVQTAIRNWYHEDRPGPPTAAAIRRFTISAEESRVAKTRARQIAAGTTPAPSTSLRKSDPQRWRLLMEQGAQQRKTELGIPD